MSESHEPISDTAFTCDFGTVRLDRPFAEQPSLQQFLNAPTSEEGRLVSDELLRRLLTIVGCVIQQELADLKPKQVLAELHVGYELWKALTPEVKDGIRKPEDLLESAWINQHDTSPPPKSKIGIVLPQYVEQLIKRCQEEVLCRINSELLSNKSLYVLIYGFSQNSPEFFSLSSRKSFGRSGCPCVVNGRQYASDCRTGC